MGPDPDWQSRQAIILRLAALFHYTAPATFQGWKPLKTYGQARKQRPVSQDQLFEQMSEVISLREKVAQAELAARKLIPPLEQRDETAGPDR